MIRDGFLYCDQCGGSINGDGSSAQWTGTAVVCSTCLSRFAKLKSPPHPSLRLADFRPVNPDGAIGIATIAAILVFIMMIIGVVLALVAVLDLYMNAGLGSYTPAEEALTLEFLAAGIALAVTGLFGMVPVMLLRIVARFFSQR